MTVISTWKQHARDMYNAHDITCAIMHRLDGFEFESSLEDFDYVRIPDDVMVIKTSTICKDINEPCHFGHIVFTDEKGENRMFKLTVEEMAVPESFYEDRLGKNFLTELMK
jgi:hypothetical protein